MLKLSLRESSTETLIVPEHTLADCNGTILASLIAELIGGERIESRPVWIVQEERLTYEAGEGSSGSKSRIEDTGEGLPEFLDELGRRDGAHAVAEYLRHLNSGLTMVLVGLVANGDFKFESPIRFQMTVLLSGFSMERSCQTRSRTRFMSSLIGTSGRSLGSMRTGAISMEWRTFLTYLKR